MRSLPHLLHKATFLFLSAVVAGCGPGMGGDPDGTSTVRGSVTDDEGYQAQRLGGAGSVSAASNVRVQAVRSDGTLELLAEAAVEADGSYEAEVPAGEQKLIVEAVDDGGEVVASAILEASGNAGDTTTCTPMTTESSVEAQVFVHMVTEAGNVDEVNTIDLRTRITARTAGAVRTAEEDGEDVSGDLQALAEATLAAQRTEIEAYAEAGIVTTQKALFEAELAASQSLSASLDAGEENAVDAYAEFLAALDAVAESEGATAEDRARAESCAGMSFRATVDVRLEADTALSQQIASSAVLAAASLEARAAAIAMDAVLEAGGAATDVQTQGQTAGADLRSSISAATTTTAAASAYADFSAAVVGEADVEASVLGAYLGVDVVTAASAQAAVDASLQASASLDAALEAALDSALSTTGEVDFDALAQAVVGAYGSYFAAVETAGAAMTPTFGSDASTAVSVLILAEGSYRLGG